MAVIAMDSVTLASVLEVQSTRRYYLLQQSTLNPPLVPSTNPPAAPWSTTEPNYTAGSTTSLYTTDIWVFSDNTFDYIPVQKSSSYEAAKVAYNLAKAAQDAADAALPTITTDTPNRRKTFRNVLSWAQLSANVSGLIVIDTPIKMTAEMFTIHIKGYNYLAGSSDIDCTLTGYAYTSTQITNTGFTNVGTMPVTARMGINVATNTLCLILKSNAALNYWQYPQLVIDEASVGYTLPPDTWVSGWSASLVTEANLATGRQGIIVPPISDAQATADKAYNEVLGKTNVTYSLNKPALAAGAALNTTIGDIWHQYVSGDVPNTDAQSPSVPGRKIIGSWTSDGTTWTPWVSLLTADVITGGVLNASIGMWTDGKIIAGNWVGTCAVMSGAYGFETKRVGADDIQYTSTNMGNPNGDNRLAIYKSDKSEPTFEVSEDGDISANDMILKEDPVIKGLGLLGKVADPNAEDGWLDPFPTGFTAVGDYSSWAGDGRKATAPNATAVVAGVGYMSFQMKAGRSYRVMMPYNYHVSSVISSNGRAQVTLRYTWGTSGGKPTVPNDSSTLVAADVHNHSSAVSWESGRLNFMWMSPFAVDTWVMLYVSIQAINCVMQPAPAASPVDSWRMTVEDVGPNKDVPDTADKFVIGTPPVAPKANYVMTWTATASENYLGSGSPSSMTIDQSRNILRHGYYDGQAGDSRSAWVVSTSAAGVGNDGSKTIPAALSGAVITKAEIFVHSLHWWAGNGGTLYYRPLGATTLPGTMTNAQAPSTVLTKKFTARSQGFWMPVPTSWFSATKTGIVYGPTASSSQSFYGYFADHLHPTVAYRPKIRLSYTR